MASPIAIVAYLLLFSGVAVAFLFANLVIGRLVRPRLPNREKLEVYECGEPTIGSSFVQFDLRFYVVALLFIIFDVEVAFFFPWATVYGKATQLASPDMPVATAAQDAAALSAPAAERLRELGIDPAAPLDADEAAELRQAGRSLALASLCDIGVFFAVLLVGFAYVWRRGDLDWVRALRANKGSPLQRPPLQVELDPHPVRSGSSILTA
ncbi:MAG TPA: NADH-quinone oxidoreductase subunit A [Lacipirellulaceae bacterium]|nr:NADH-quinone oxidoreductase subunit A [Lacipirellulaceae bacterium]